MPPMRKKLKFSIFQVKIFRENVENLMADEKF
jgi:hypothetical protein